MEFATLVAADLPPSLARDGPRRPLVARAVTTDPRRDPRGFLFWSVWAGAIGHDGRGIVGAEKPRAVRADYLVELRGFEPLAPAVRASACLTAPLLPVLEGLSVESAPLDQP